MICPDCFGTGREQTDKRATCQRCEGGGSVTEKMRQWIRRGGALSHVRRIRKIRIENLAICLDLDIETIFFTERGMIEPVYDEQDITSCNPSKTMTALERIEQLERAEREKVMYE